MSCTEDFLPSIFYFVIDTFLAQRYQKVSLKIFQNPWFYAIFEKITTGSTPVICFLKPFIYAGFKKRPSRKVSNRVSNKSSDISIILIEILVCYLKYPVFVRFLFCFCGSVAPCKVCLCDPFDL